MSTQEIGALIESVNEMTGTVAAKMGEIDNRVDEAEQEYLDLIQGIRSDFPFYRLTKNQELKINNSLTVGTTGTPDGWSNRDSSKITVEIVAYTETGKPELEKSPIIQKMWMDLKGYIPRHNNPNFAVIRLTVDASAINTPDMYTIYQGPLPNGVPMTYGCWIMVESGEVKTFSNTPSQAVPNNGEWHERILHRDMSNGGASYEHAPHIYLTPGSSCLIALPAVVVGKIPIGKWGFIDKPIFEREG
ncbi:hypothetical protein ABCL21_004459 [Vibrio parahaemolyticus]